jgi:lysozyme family protein
MIFSKDFLDNINIIFENEGVYDNNPLDPGGETFFGIARNYHPEWRGWEIVDDLKKEIDLENDFNVKDLECFPELYNLILEFYYKNFWEAAKIDKLPEKVQKIVFDATVNMGVKRTIKILQKALGVIVDGRFGAITLNAVESIDPELLYTKFKLERINYYTDLVERKPKYKKFLLGWIKRTLKT